jgi:hypothetical protein
VRVFNGDGLDEKFNFFAFTPSFTGGVRVAMGDVTGDGTPDIIAAAGPGGGPHVRVFDGVTGAQIPGPLGSFFAYDIRFSGGVFVAAADFDGDGLADIVSGAGSGGGPHIRVFSGADGRELVGFFDPPKGGNGVRVATGDIDGDGTPDIITGSGSDVPAVVRVFSGLTAQAVDGPLGSIAPYPGFRGGVYVAAGDVNGDGRDDVITGAGAGGGPHVKAFSGVDGAEIASFFAYSINFTGGVRVGVGDVDQNGSLEIIAGAGPGGGPHVRAFQVHGGGEVASFFAFDLTFGGGVFVAGAAPMAAGAASDPVQAETGAPSFVSFIPLLPTRVEAQAIVINEDRTTLGLVSHDSRDLAFALNEELEAWLWRDDEDTDLPARSATAAETELIRLLDEAVVLETHGF